MLARAFRPELDAKRLRSMYLDFFKARAHAVIPSASLIPDGDGSVLFTTAGMHPLVPYLMGREHPAGSRLTGVQKCVRTNDIEEVGDLTHLTFFEMLGNWSLGDYYKADSIRWSFEFLTGSETLGISPDSLWVTVFDGNTDVPRDEESASIWRSLGLPPERIIFLGEEDNWWAAGPEGPCGPDTEIFYDMTGQACEAGPECSPGRCGCGRFFEIWNNVFMSYDRRGASLTPLPRRNVDTGMGLERTLAALTGVQSVYETASFKPIMAELQRLSGRSADEIAADANRLKAARVLADHIRTATFMLGDERGIRPSNQGQGYVLRRLIRRGVRYCEQLGLSPEQWVGVSDIVVGEYGEVYPSLAAQADVIRSELSLEKDRFEATLARGVKLLERELERLRQEGGELLPGQTAFRLYDTYGFPFEFTQELVAEQGLTVDENGFAKAAIEHQERSRSEAAKSGLADDSVESTRYHTATHLLHAALRKVLGEQVEQKGSNINSERMRFDFSLDRPMTPLELQEAQSQVQAWIDADLPVRQRVLPHAEARSLGAIGLFNDRYGDEVSIYEIGDVSVEFCGGPHVERTSELGRFQIKKEQSSSAGVRRIRAHLTP